ncbi:hypothetical protein L3X38_014659 [Prunus dulcis]|uniref:Uncharacterized protein n=1 Tax=Prunus dulcis TaxID=3755 RepID=A0AAD4ZI63_PRUDU|nr:hypothetical protein L3X38_014659 [Prunus dulcis]
MPPTLAEEELNPTEDSYQAQLCSGSEGLMKKGPLPSGSTKLMKKVGPLLSGLVFWSLPLSGAMSTMTKTDLLLSASALVKIGFSLDSPAFYTVCESFDQKKKGMFQLDDFISLSTLTECNGRTRVIKIEFMYHLD